MPCRPCARFEGHAGALNKRRIGCLEKRIDPNRAREPLCRPLRRWLRTNFLDFHVFDYLTQL